MTQQIDLSGTNRVTKAYLIDHLVIVERFSRDDAVKAVEGFVNAIVAALRSGADVNISNVSTLRPRRSAERTARNPQTGGRVCVPEKNVVRWTPSPTLLDVINGRTERESLSRKAPKGSL